MKIIKTKDQSVIIYINEKIKQYIEREEIKEYDSQLFIKWLRPSLTAFNIAVWVALEEDKCLGYLIVQVNPTFTYEKLNIISLFGDTPEIEAKLLEGAEVWAKSNGIKICQTSTFHPKKWKDRGFQVVEHLLTKEI
jgi:hypothetical protein